MLKGQFLLFVSLVLAAMAEEPKVAIIGAGVAGMSTANRLLEKGFKNFEIFEALDRYGGRVFPVKYGEGFLQHGAQFINGDKNPIYDLATKLGVISGVYQDYGQLDDTPVRFGNCPVNEEDIDAFYAFTDPLDDKYYEIAVNDTEKSYEETFKSMFDRDFAAFLKKQKAETGFRRDVFEALRLTMRSYFEAEYAAKWEELSLRNLMEWDDSTEDEVTYATNKIGYTAIIDYLRSKIPGSQLHFNHRVANVDYSGPKTVLTLVDGTKLGGFDFVVVTSAIGHLKKFARQMFTPSLPKRTLDAIDKIGMGASAKIFFEYSDVSWKDDSMIPLPVIGCLGRKELDPIESEFNAFESIPWAPNIFMAWIAGHGPEKVDNISDQELSRVVTKLMRDVYKNQSIPEPIRIIRTKWTQNDLFGGSYSFISYEQAQAGIKPSDMAVPVRQNNKIRVQFAGEATHPRMFQTTIGAYLSGKREADRILSSIRP